MSQRTADRRLSLSAVLRQTGREREVRAMADRARAEHESKLLTYREDPVRWANDRAKLFIPRQQRSVADSVRQHRYTAVHSAHDLGKSFIAAALACWWIDAHPLGDAFVVSTAPTFPQVAAILWREISALHARAGLPGKITSTSWKIDGQLVAFGRKPADTNMAAFQGIHARYVLVIIDEACGVVKPIYDAVDALATNEYARVLAIGNPDDPASHFATICKPGSGWNPIHLDGLESPNFTGEEVPADLRPLLLSPTWVEERRERWGEESALYVSKVRGLFPDDSEDGVVRWSRLSRARIGRPVPYTPDELLPVELGVDVGAGGDFSSIRERRGRMVGRVWRDHQPDTMRLVGKVVQAIELTGATCVKVDATGIGKGVADRLGELRREGVHKATIVPVYVGGATSKPKMFVRLRDQIWWEVGRELTEDGMWDFSGLDDDDFDDLASQMIAPKYAPNSAGRIEVEKKDETRKRLGRSPDDADALLLAFFTGVGPERFMADVVQRHRPVDRPPTPDVILGMPTGPGPGVNVQEPMSSLFSKRSREQLGIGRSETEGDGHVPRH